MYSHLVLISVLVLVFSKTTLSGDIKCYCNLPECESTNNLCYVKEGKGACYSDFVDYTDLSKMKQGCIQDISKQSQCGNAPGSTGAPRSLLLCCIVPMCNQVAHTILGSYINLTDGSGVFNLDNRNSNSYSNHEVWFKAATIAVPICGAMILVLLVTLACKILRADHVNVDKFCQEASNASAQPNQYTHAQDAAKKVPLLYDSRHNCEEFRYITSTRIHYGQNVNVLKEPSDRPEKNVNLEVAREQVVVEIENEGERNESSDTVLDVRVECSTRPEPSLSLNLDKSENVNICNLYASPGNLEVVPTGDKCSKYLNKSFV